jgi:NADH:ubiquinone oxidoreductase subunit 4 (subunit M)
VPGRALGAVLVLLALALLVLGVYPTPLVSLLQAALAAL